MDHLKEKNRIETLIQSLARYSEKALLILSGKSDMSASARKIGPALVFERLWEEPGIRKVLTRLLSSVKDRFNAPFSTPQTNAEYVAAELDAI